MATPEQEVTTAHNLLGSPNLDAASKQLVNMELEAGVARNTSVGPNAWANDQYDAFQGAWIPTNMDESQWQATVNAVQTWASNTDFRGIPSWQDVVGMYEWGTQNGISMTDTRAVAGYLAAKLPPDKQTQMPWAASGMNKTGWDSSVQSFSDQIESLTGSVPTGDLLNQIHDAINTNQSSTDFMTKLKSTADFQSGGKYGYVAFGKTYDTYQQYKNDPSTRQAIVSRFGSGAANSDQAYQESLANPLIAPAGAGPRSGSNQQSARVQADQVGRSSVR